MIRTYRGDENSDKIYKNCPNTIKDNKGPTFGLQIKEIPTTVFILLADKNLAFSLEMYKALFHLSTLYIH